MTEVDLVTSSRESTVQRGDSNIKHNHASERVNKNCARLLENKKKMNPLGRVVKKTSQNLTLMSATREVKAWTRENVLQKMKFLLWFTRVGQEYGLK